MFEYQKQYWNVLKGTHMKVVMNIILFYIFMAVISLIAAGIFVLGVSGIIHASLNSEQLSAFPIIGVILAALFVILFVIFVFVPLSYSYYNYFFLAYEEKASKFSHGLFQFRKGIYLKSLGLVIILFLITWAAGMAINMITSPLLFGISGLGSISPETLESFTPNITFTTGILIFLIAIVSIVFSIFVQAVTIAIWFRHLERPENKLGEKISTGFNVVFKNFGQFIKLLVSMLLIVILLLVVELIIIIGVSLLVGLANIQGIAAAILFIITGLLLAFIAIFMSYICYGGCVTFYKNNNTFKDDETIEYVEG